MPHELLCMLIAAVNSNARTSLSRDCNLIKSIREYLIVQGLVQQVDLYTVTALNGGSDEANI